LWLAVASSVLIPAGKPAPMLEGQTLDGGRWSETLTGQITIVEFFATWCPHCRRSLAGYQRLEAAREVRLIIVDVDENPALVHDFFARNPPPPNAGVLIDQSGSARQNWGVTGFPVAYVVDQNGIIRKSFSGWGDGSVRELVDLIDRLRRPPQAQKAARSRRGKAAPPRESGISADEHARSMGVEVIR
jgi:thiol-disulfide isomerase/thioredoxin